MKKYLLYFLLLTYCVSMDACNLFEVRKPDDTVTVRDSGLTVDSSTAQMDSVVRTDSVPASTFSKTHTDTTKALPPSQTIHTGRLHPDTVVQFAKTLLGTPYVYASTDPNKGFDCSGFITYVFNHFGITVPRSSIDFTNVGKTVTVAEAKPGDLILFTGTDSTETAVGHMGLVVSNNADSLHFIHSSSGKAMGVIVTPLNGYYKKRFVRIARIFPQNDFATSYDANTLYLPAPYGVDSARTVQPSTPRYHRNKTVVTKHKSRSRRRRGK